MSYLLLLIFLAVCIAAGAYILQKEKSPSLAPETRNGVVFLLINQPVVLLLLKADRSWGLFQVNSWLLQGILIAAAMLLIDAFIYYGIKRIRLFQ